MMMNQIKEKNQSKKTNKIEIKSMRIKLNIKNKWNDTFIFWREKEQRKKKREKKNLPELNHCPVVALTTPPEKSRWVAYDATVKGDGMISHALSEERKSLILAGASIPHTNHFYFENNNYIY